MDKMKTVVVFLMVLSIFMAGNQVRGQSFHIDKHRFYFQKVIGFSGSSMAQSTRIFDSLNVYGYISGYDSSQFEKLNWAGKFAGSGKDQQAQFFSYPDPDSIQIAFHDSPIPDLQQQHKEPLVDYGFILMGNIVAGAFWLYDLYYSEMLNHAGVQFTEKTKVLCVYPWEKKASVHYRIVAIEENDEGQYEISYTYINYTNPLRPKIEKSGSAVITKEKFLDGLKEQLKATSQVDIQNQCASSGLPRLIALPEKRFFYSLPCLDQHGRERADEPMDLSLFVEKLFYKYLYNK